MGSMFFIQSSTITEIANAIRSKASMSGPIAVSEMASAINNISAAASESTPAPAPIRDEIYLNVFGVNEQHVALESGAMYIEPPLGELPYGFFSYDHHIVTSMYLASATFIDYEVCASMSSLGTVIAPLCEKIEAGAFKECEALSIISFPMCSEIGYGAFASCSSLTTISFPTACSIYEEAFSECVNLVSAYFNVETTFSESVFASVLFSSRSQTLTLYFNGSVSDVEIYAPSNVFGDTEDLPRTIYEPAFDGNGNSTGPDTMIVDHLSIFVPSSLYYNFRYNWGAQYFANNFIPYDPANPYVSVSLD